MQSGKRPGIAADLIGDYAVTETRIDIEILVGVNDYLIDLRHKALERPCHHRLAAQFAQTFIDAAHAAALATSQNYAGYFGRFKFQVCSFKLRFTHAAVRLT